MLLTFIFCRNRAEILIQPENLCSLFETFAQATESSGDCYCSGIAV